VQSDGQVRSGCFGSTTRPTLALSQNNPHVLRLLS
jgi:hypothetical protein